MAGKPFQVIDVIDLTYVVGGVDKQTRAAQQVLDQATQQVKNLAQAVGPKDTGMSQMMMQILQNRRSGSGSGSAPATASH